MQHLSRRLFLPEQIGRRFLFVVTIAGSVSGTAFCFRGGRGQIENGGSQKFGVTVTTSRSCNRSARLLTADGGELRDLRSGVGV